MRVKERIRKTRRIREFLFFPTEYLVKNYTTLVFDVETGGLRSSESDVLSFSYQLYRNGKKVDEGTRYYYSRPNRIVYSEAIAVNGLTKEKITEKREQQKASYPEYFAEDKEVLSLFEEADILVAHNIRFDYSFVVSAFDRMFDAHKYCTMRNSTYECYIPHSYFGLKWPKLEEAVAELGLLEDNKREFHDSSVDVYYTAKLFKKLIRLGYVENLPIPQIYRRFARKTLEKLIGFAPKTL